MAGWGWEVSTKNMSAYFLIETHGEHEDEVTEAGQTLGLIGSVTTLTLMAEAVEDSPYYALRNLLDRESSNEITEVRRDIGKLLASNRKISEVAIAGFERLRDAIEKGRRRVAFLIEEETYAGDVEKRL